MHGACGLRWRDYPLTSELVSRCLDAVSCRCAARVELWSLNRLTSESDSLMVSYDLSTGIFARFLQTYDAVRRRLVGAFSEPMICDSYHAFRIAICRAVEISGILGRIGRIITEGKDGD